MRLGLGSVLAGADDVLREVGDRLDHLEPRLWSERGELRLAVTVRASDVWLAVLLAMATVTGTGYPVGSLDARPSTW